MLGISCASLDLVARLLVLERREALRWNHDPHGNAGSASNSEEEKPGASDASTSIPPAAEQEQLPLLSVIVRLCKSRRATITCLVTFLYGYAGIPLYARSSS